MKLEKLSELLAANGFKNQLEGDSQIEVISVETLEDAKQGQISFLSNPVYKDKLNTTQASAVIVNNDETVPSGLPVIKCNNPYGAIAATIILIHGYRRHPQWGIDGRSLIHPSACIGDNANIAPNVYIAENVVIGDNAIIYPGCYIANDVSIGDDVILYPNVVIYDGSVIGNKVSLHAGTVVGQDGLGYAPVNGEWLKIPQIGRAVIEDDVEMGANCAIDRATLGETRIRKGTKFSDAVVIGHGTKIGERCMFVAQVGIAGSVDVGNDV
ncbi:MAG: UDP-3-O-(3-hydroxymyristoyl)glucosamine N-acyltransferase, partial [Gammaproteobacteria bacterium]